MVARREPRREARAHFELPARVTLLETDADNHEIEMDALRGDIRSIKAMMLGVMVSATTATIVGAINLAFGNLGGG